MKDIIKKSAAILLKNPRYLIIGGYNPLWILNRFFAEIRFERNKKTEREFVSFLLGKEIDNIYWEEAKKTPKPILAAVTMTLKPRVILETGVQEGSSSLSFLYALEKNNLGKLYSIEIRKAGETAYGKKYFLPREEIGYLVPRELHHRWSLIWGDSRVELPKLLKELGQINLFFHDSLHTEEHMMFEYKNAWPFLKKGGCLLSDDIGASFAKFAREVGKPFSCTSGLPKIGGIRKG